MPKKPRRPAIVRTPEERLALVEEIQRRRQLDDGRSIEVIARELGVSDKSYYNWLRRDGSSPSGTSRSGARPRSTGTPSKFARRYSDERRAELRGEIARRCAAGEALGVVLKDLDLGRSTYRRWLDAEEMPAFRAVNVVVPVTPVAEETPVVPTRVSVALAPAPLPLTLVAPGGYRVEGLAVETAAALLRALA